MSTRLTTEDGSDTVYSSQFDETYHSIHGAIQESNYIFIKEGFQAATSKTLKIFEVGFGTGLNALLTWSKAKESNVMVEYTSIEYYPLVSTIYSTLNYTSFVQNLPREALSRLHTCSWNKWHELESTFFKLKKIKADFTQFQISDNYNLIYFDAFSPEKNPTMWEQALFEGLYNHMAFKGQLLTYCAKGEIRRRLTRAGFRVERLKGPPGKREILKAIKTPF